MKRSALNRLANITNKYQGSTKKVLCVCSAGLLRSPTAAVVLSSDPYNFNTRCCGVGIDYALIPYDDALHAWADEIVTMEAKHSMGMPADKPIINLDIPDLYAYRDPE